MSWLSWVVVGLIAGLLAKGVTGRHRPGCLGTIILGALFKAAGGEAINSFSLYSILVAFVGATALLFLWGLLRGGSKSA